VLEEPHSLTNEWKQFWKKRRAIRLKYIDVTGTDATEICQSDLALIGTPLSKQDLTWSEHTCEGGSIRDVGPASDLQIARVNMFETYETFESILFRVL
jgi:hypothetical protein